MQWWYALKSLFENHLKKLMIWYISNTGTVLDLQKIMERGNICPQNWSFKKTHPPTWPNPPTLYILQN
jgi:hypothetical protein